MNIKLRKIKGIDPIEMGKRLRNVREFLHLSRKQMAEIFDMTQSFYSAIERGVKPLPLRHYETLITKYGISQYYLETGMGIINDISTEINSNGVKPSNKVFINAIIGDIESRLTLLKAELLKL